jgi:dihydroneopterin aldolase
MKHTIEVNGIKVYSHHGCMSEEKEIGGHYIVDVSVVTNFSDSFHSDDLKDTVDYVVINAIVKHEMAIRSKLIEHVGHRMIQRMKTELKGIFSIRIKVTKLSPPIDGDVHDVAIIIEENC